MENKGALIRMFTSNEWTLSKFAKSTEGKKIEEVVIDRVLEKYCHLFERCFSINQSPSTS